LSPHSLHHFLSLGVCCEQEHEPIALLVTSLLISCWIFLLQLQQL